LDPPALRQPPSQLIAFVHDQIGPYSKYRVLRVILKTLNGYSSW
jgi:hypothetical protein